MNSNVKEIESIDTVLRQSSLFSSLGDEELRELGHLASIVSVSTDEVLFREGEEGSQLFVVVSGTVRLSTVDANGRMQPTALLGAGQAFGEMAVLEGSRRSATATVTADSTLACIDGSDLHRLAAKYPDSQVKIMREGLRLVSNRLRTSNARFWDLARNAMYQKRQMTQSRSRFLSLVSHELRTPLAIIKSSAQLMLRSRDANPADLLEKIVTESNHLAMLVDDLISFSLLQGDGGLHDRSRFDAVELARKVIRELRATAASRSVRFSLRSSRKRLWISGDPILIGRALHHLADNAIKFSPPSSEVTVSIERDDGGRTRLEVIDHGEGIPANRLTSLLEGFVQAQDPLNRDMEGMGIGLSLVDEVVRAHGGRLLIDSAPGRGSRFTIVLPSEVEGNGLPDNNVCFQGGQP